MGVRPSQGQQPSLPCCAVEVSLNDRLASHRLGVSLSTRRRPCVGVSQTGSRRGLQQERLTKQPEESQLPRRVGGRESSRRGQPAPRGPHPLRQAARRPCDVQPAQSLLSHGNVSMCVTSWRNRPHTKLGGVATSCHLRGVGVREPTGGGARVPVAPAPRGLLCMCPGCTFPWP